MAMNISSSTLLIIAIGPNVLDFYVLKNHAHFAVILFGIFLQAVLVRNSGIQVQIISNFNLA